MIPGFERLSDPAYVAGLADLPLEEIRNRRDECQALENAVSYVRRVAHGRLDIAGSELAKRSGGGEGTDLAELIDRLPAALADSGRTPGLPQRAVPALEPPEEIVAPIMATLDAILGPGELASLTSVDTADLATTVDALRTFETGISQQRRALHDVIDDFQAEIGRRYQAGEISVDSLLN